MYFLQAIPKSMAGVIQYLTILCYFSIYIQKTTGKEDLLKSGTMNFWYLDHADLTGKAGQIWSSPVAEDTTHSETESSGNDTDFWLITAPVTRNKSQLMYVDVETRISECHVDISTCYFEVYIYNGTEKLDIPKKSNKRETKEYLLKNFYLTHNINVSALNRRENKTFTIYYNGSEVIFGIRARGVSGDLYGMKLYYYYCEEKIYKSLKLVETISPCSDSKQVALNCTSNSSPANSGTVLRAFCQWNGTWSIANNTECFCRRGFEPSKGCTRCLNHYYKPQRSNDRCEECPRHNSNDSTNTFCRCREGYYRLPSEIENVARPCYGLPHEVEDLTVQDNSSGSVFLEWFPPSYTGELDQVLYDIKCFSCEDLDCVNKTACSDAVYKPAKNDSNYTYVIITGLKPGAEYVFQVYSKNLVSRPENQDDWAFGEKFHKLKSVPDSGASEVINKTRYIIFGVIGLAVILILLVTLVCVLKSRRNEQTGSQMSLTEYGMALPTLGQKMYVDPSNYDDPEYALKEFANEINPSSLSLERVIGGGEFGDVYKGTLTMSDDTVVLVAAKTLKNDCTEKSRRDFFLEASAMGQFDDPNVIHLEGVITKVAPKMIITEFMANGSLDNFLKKNDGNLTVLQMIGMARGVASGMKYLASINFVHRDLAARNILINETMVCKVADFGLSRELETEDSSRGEYFTSGGRIPVRWTAPEAIKYRKFSTASDVWSYGILLWEIMSFAERPYWDWDNFKVMERVDQGYRMPLPLKCPAVVHELMLDCWHRDRGQRPAFEDIVKIMDEWIRSPETVHDERLQYRRSRVLTVESSTSVKEWLDTIKMSSYMPHFTEGGYKELADLAGLMDSDLKALGITLVGHRNKMLRTIRSLPITNPGTNQQRSKPLRH